MIRIENLNKKFGKVQVLKNLNTTIEQGGIFAFLGPNGLGKTTLIKCILGMVLPDSGHIFIDDHPILKQYKYKNNISYLPQVANFPSNLKVQELIKLIKNLRQKPAHESPLIERFKLHSFLDKKLGNLSGGTKQKVNIVLAFMFDNDFIILDEPTNGLDPISVIALKELIMHEKAKNKTILITSHIMSFVEEIADEIVFLLDGKIHFKGSLSALQKQTQKHNLEHAIANLLTQENV